MAQHASAHMKLFPQPSQKPFQPKPAKPYRLTPSGPRNARIKEKNCKTHPAQSFAHPFPLLQTSQLAGADVHPGIPCTAQALELAAGLQNSHEEGLPVQAGAVVGVWRMGGWD